MSKTLKFGIFTLAALCVVLVVLTVVGAPSDTGLAETITVTEEITSAADEDLIQAVGKALEAATGRWESFDYQIDHIQIQEDGQAALVWLVAVERETGNVLGREPELALAELGSRGEWQVFLEDGDDFEEKFTRSPFAEKSLIGDILEESQVQPKSERVFGGYYLPWAADLEKRLTWSVSHTSCYPTYYCTYAFDFADGTMFPLVAAKGGQVFHWKDTCANGDTYCTNSITLQDRSTTPWTYQIYIHIAQGSIPDHLKEVGTPVLQGQYIADVDDTGYSTGHHVHFMVVAEDTRYISGNGYVWGVAEDITYRDVDINWDPITQGGRPRLAYEAETYGGEGRTYYVSGNEPANPPTGGISSPEAKTHVTTANLAVTGWGKDDIAVTKYEILAKLGTDWVTIQEAPGGESFSTTVDLCQADLPDGPFTLALRVWDYEGNPSGIQSIRSLVKDVRCGDAGIDPFVRIARNDGLVALPRIGLVNAYAARGSLNAEIVSVEFWYHNRNWSNPNWVFLGKDETGSNGWQAPINTTNIAEGNTYTILAVATDSAGNQDADVVFSAIVDHTPPTLQWNPINLPIMTEVFNLQWTASDSLSGMDFYVLEQKLNDGDSLILEKAIPGYTTAYDVPVEPGNLIKFKLVGYDRSGNAVSQSLTIHTDGYVFPYVTVMPFFLNLP